MEPNTDFQTHSVVPVWNRTTRREEDMPVNVAERAVARGLADLLGPGSLPFDKAAAAGGPTVGDGTGHAFVEPLYRRGTSLRVSLAVAQRMVASGMGRYVGPDGSPLREPAVEQEPLIEAGASATDEPRKAASKFRRFAGLLGGLVV